MEFLGRTYLVNDKATKMYAFTLDSLELQQKPLNKDQCRGEKPEELEAGAIHHCHHNRKATEDRAQEQTCAKWKLRAASGGCLVFMIAEVVGGHVAGSLAVITDAAHLLIDLTSFLLSLFSLCLSSKPPSKRLNFGWRRAGVLVSLACERLLYPNYQIQATLMIIVSSCAVAANTILSVILHQKCPAHNHKEVQANASVRAAFVHTLGDLFQSIGVLTSALIIYFKPEYKMADPICTFVFSGLVLASTVTLLKDFSILLMEVALRPPSGTLFEVDHRILVFWRKQCAKFQKKCLLSFLGDTTALMTEWTRMTLLRVQTPAQCSDATLEAADGQTVGKVYSKRSPQERFTTNLSVEIFVSYVKELYAHYKDTKDLVATFKALTASQAKQNRMELREEGFAGPEMHDVTVFNRWHMEETTVKMTSSPILYQIPQHTVSHSPDLTSDLSYDYSK
ncbi:hypothetical protein E5288_WYG010648 [Bos mutus]|uniref:Proton-coupled zinc antiporter SLC30A8 n=1 Tax=Bos mutus TaxID=72004 RepID=A0A6B0RRS8_9CETA|nr:hypothetical protein [Bos mutus]